MRDTLIVFLGLISVVMIGAWSFFHTDRQKNQIEGDRTVLESEKSVPENIQKISVSELKDIVLTGSSNERTVLLDSRPTSLWFESHIIGSESFSEDARNDFLSENAVQGISRWIIIASDAKTTNQSIAILQNSGVKDDQIKIFDGTYEKWEAETGLVIRQANPESAIDTTKVRLASPEEARKEIAKGGRWFLLDIRSPESFASGHLPGATNIPLFQVEKDRSLIPKTANIFVYGKDDRESFSGGVLLFDLGFFNTLTLSAGFNEWKSKNFPTEK